MGERFNPYSTPTADDLEYRQMKQRIAELEALVEKTAEDGATVGWMIAEDRLRKRIEELEAELHANQQSWQEHDQGRIFAAKQMRLRIAELEHQLAGCTCPTVAQLRRQGGEYG